MDNLEVKPNKYQTWLAIFLKRYFGLFLFLLIVLFFAISYYFLLLPRFQEAVAAISQNNSTQQRTYVAAVQKLSDLKALTDSYHKIDPSSVKKVEELLPSEYIQEQLFLELEQVIIKNGYVVNSISVQKELGVSPGLPSSDIGRVRVNISVSAVNYADFKKLLAIMESNVRLMDVDNLSFSPGGQSASFSFSTYFLKAK